MSRITVSNSVTLSRTSYHDLLDGIEQLAQAGNQLCDLRVYAKDGTHVMFSRIMICSMSPFLTDILSSGPCVYDPWPSLITDISPENIAIIFNFVFKGCLPETLEPHLILAFQSLGILIESYQCTKEPSHGNNESTIPILDSSLDADYECDLEILDPKAEISITTEDNEDELNLFLEEDFDSLDGDDIFNEVTGMTDVTDITSHKKRLPSRRSKRKSYAVKDPVLSDEEPSPKKQRYVKESSDDEYFDPNTLFEVKDEDIDEEAEDEAGEEALKQEKEAKELQEKKLKAEEEREKKRKAKQVENSEVRKLENNYVSKIGARLAELQEKGISYEAISLKNDYRVKKLKNSAQPWAMIDHIYPRYSMYGHHSCTLCSFRTNLGQILEQHMIYHTDNDLDSDYFHCLIPDCRERAGSLAKWEEHASKAHLELVYKCPKCDVYCKSLSHRTIHLKNVHNVVTTQPTLTSDNPQDPLECAHCGAKYSKNRTYKAHLEFESTYHNNHCPHMNCEFTFSSWAEHVEHINKEHNQTPLYICGICPETFSLKSEKLKHRKEMHGSSAAMQLKHQICQTCGISQRSMTVHMAMAHGEDKKGFCRLCGENFEKIIYHRMTVHLNKISKVPCKHCGFLVPTTRVDGHVCDIEKSKTPISNFLEKECLICVKKFDNMMELRSHLKTYHKDKLEKAESFSCQICDQTFKIKKELIEHSMTHFSEDKKLELTCQFCQLLCPSKAQKSSHIRTAHVVPFACGVCATRFKTEDLLTEHEVQGVCVDKRKGSAACDVCGKIVLKKYLPKHVLNTHTPESEKPFKCQYCPKGFGSKLEWENHENTHTKAKPHMCGFCGWGFNSRKSLASHEIKVHNREPKLNTKAGKQNRIDGLMKTRETSLAD